MITAVTRFVVRHESALPLAIGALWWAAMYPGLFAEDSILNLEEARTGPVSVWFTAWWVYLIKALTFDGRAVPLATLAGVLVLAFAVRSWAVAVLPAGPARAWALVALCASPLVGAMGIQLRHDTWMTAGLLLWTAVVTRTRGFASPPTLADAALLVAVPLLLPTRHNGLATVLVAGAAGLWLFRERRLRHAAVMAAVVAATLVVTASATRAAGHARSVDPAQTVEWLMADVSCLLTLGVQPSAQEWAVLERIASRADWPQARACRYVNPLQFAPSFQYAHAEGQVMALLSTWWQLARRHPSLMAETHLKRVALFVPPFLAGWPDAPSAKFINPGIFPNEAGLAWRFPRVAWAAQLPIRAWNRTRLLLANAAIWLLVLIAAWWAAPAGRAPIAYTVIVAGVLLAGLVATAPVSEGRYGLFILICGQLVAIHWLLLKNRLASTTAR